MTFAWTPYAFRKLDEAFVEREIVSDWVLPTLVVSPEKREALLKELVYLAQRTSFNRGRLDGHNYEGYIRVGRLLRPSEPGSGLLLVFLVPLWALRRICCGASSLLVITAIIVTFNAAAPTVAPTSSITTTTTTICDVSAAGRSTTLSFG